MMKPEYDILTKQIKTMGYSFGHCRYLDKGVIGYCVDALSADGHRYVVAADDLIEALKMLVKELEELKVKKFIVAKLISGGQTGADRGGLDAAIELGVPHGGKCPKGRKAEDGVIPAKYNLEEIDTADYKKRTELNVIESDATLVFTMGKPSGGTKLTVDYAVKHKKPYHIADVASPDDNVIAGDIIGWLGNSSGGLFSILEDDAKKVPADPVLNVAGPRESKFPGIQERVKQIMLIVLGGKVYPTGQE